MAEAKRRGYGEDGIYFDHRGDCRDGDHHKTCTGRWRGVVSLGFDVDGKRIRSKVSGQTKAEVKDKLKALHSELDAGIRTTAAYAVEKAVADWLDEGLPGRAAKTVEVNRDSLRPLLAIVGTIPLRDLTVQDVRTALKKMAATHATRTLQKAHNCLTRAVRHAEGQDLVRRNVSALVDTPRGLEGRPSQSLTLEQAAALLEAAEESRLHAFIVLCLLTGVRSEEARALTWEHVALDAGTISVWRSVRAHGDTKSNRSRGRL
jgi:integrase